MHIGEYLEYVVETPRMYCFRVRNLRTGRTIEYPADLYLENKDSEPYVFRDMAWCVVVRPCLDRAGSEVSSDDEAAFRAALSTVLEQCEFPLAVIEYDPARQHVSPPGPIPQLQWTLEFLRQIQELELARRLYSEIERNPVPLKQLAAIWVVTKDKVIAENRKERP